MRKKNFLLLSAAGLSAALGLWRSAPPLQARLRAHSPRRRLTPAARLLPANCAACHQADLSGTNDAPQLAGSAFIGAWKGRTTAGALQQDQQDHAGGRARQPG